MSIFTQVSDNYHNFYKGEFRFKTCSDPGSLSNHNADLPSPKPGSRSDRLPAGQAGLCCCRSDHWTIFEFGCPPAPNLYRSVEQCRAIGAAFAIGTA
jgi:hypothetical protein